MGLKKGICPPTHLFFFSKKIFVVVFPFLGGEFVSKKLGCFFLFFLRRGAINLLGKFFVKKDLKKKKLKPFFV